MVEAASPDKLPLRSFIGANRISREVIASSFPSAVPLVMQQVTDAASEAKKEVVLSDCIGKEPDWDLKVKKLEELLKKNPQVFDMGTNKFKANSIISPMIIQAYGCPYDCPAMQCLPETSC